MSQFEEWWKTHRYEWELTDEEEGLAMLAAEYSWNAVIDEAVKVAENWVVGELEDGSDAFVPEVAEAIKELKE